MSGPNLAETSIPHHDRHCRSCRFWVTDGEPPTKGEFGTFKAGECRRFPPAGRDDHKTRFWPPVYDFDWCGEWQGPDEETQRIQALRVKE